MSVSAGNARPVGAQSAWYEGFEEAKPSWEYLGGDVQLANRQQQRTPLIRHTGERSEWIRVAGEGGTTAYFAHGVGRPRIIEELAPTVQVRADRAGVQLLAEVTLPRTPHPQTGQPLTTLIRGSSYSRVGHWQQLRIDDLPRLLTRQTHILRNEFGSEVDPREAYISKVVLNVYGGPGETNVWIDDLDIAGYVGAPDVVPRSEEYPSHGSESWRGTGTPVADEGQRRIRLDRSVLLADERPFFVRAVRWRGEPLTVLKVLGFNTIWLDRVPSAQLLAEADRVGVWLISPPPPLQAQAGPEAASVPPPALGPEYRSVLAWDLGAGLGDREGDVDRVRTWAEQIRAADNHYRRPLIARPENSLKAYSRIADILVIGRPVLGSSLELADYVQWLRLRPQLARPGTPVWVVVPTGPTPSLSRQWEAMSSGAPISSPGFTAEQLRLATYLSSAAGAKGLLFESYAAMDGSDAASETRRTALELLNLELALMEPWLAGGTFVAMAESSDPDVSAAVLRTDRARLVVPVWTGRGASQVPGPSAQRTVSVVVPGVPEADDAYNMTPGRLLPVRDKRVTGGTRITVENFALTAQVLVTQDPLARTSRSNKAIAIGRRAAELQRRLAELKLRRFEELVVPLTLAAPDTARLQNLETDVATLRGATRESLRLCDTALAARDYSAAYEAAQEAIRPMLLLQREHWLAASQSVSGAASSPLTATFATLPAHWTFLRGLAQQVASGSLLPGGDFEDLAVWRGAGWEHFQHSVPGVAADANLAREAARSGQFGLRLSAQAADPDQVPAIVEAAPVWIASAPINLEARSLVVLRGWVRIPKPLRGSADGLMIMDSTTGSALPERIQATEQWQEFVLYRVCPESGPFRVTFALSGMGTAHLDDVTIQTLSVAAPASARTPYPRTSSR